LANFRGRYGHICGTYRRNPSVHKNCTFFQFQATFVLSLYCRWLFSRHIWPICVCTKIAKNCKKLQKIELFLRKLLKTGVFQHFSAISRQISGRYRDLTYGPEIRAPNGAHVGTCAGRCALCAGPAPRGTT